MKTEQEVRNIIDIGFMWDRSDNPDEYAVYYATDKYVVTANELALVDTRLPLVIDYIIQSNADRNVTGPHGSWAHGSLAMWQDKTQDVRGTKGETLALVEATALTRSPPNGNHVLLYGVFAETDTMIVRDGDAQHVIDFAKFTGTKSMLVDPAWLDEHYPGWNDRLITMEALGASGEETAQYVLNKDPQLLVSVPMSEVGFG